MTSNAISTIDLLIYDCDGVLTDNKVIVDENGRESVSFNRGDGFAIDRIKNELKIDQVVISTEVNSIVLKRCNKLGIKAINGVGNKTDVVRNYCREKGIDLKKVMFIGNDLNDKGAMDIVGVRGCPADAEPEIMEISDWVSNKDGGCGVIRDLYRFILTGKSGNDH